jgi:hypothetical protein
MKSTSKRVAGKIVGEITSLKTGPNASDQPKEISKGGKYDQKPMTGKSTSTPPLSYSHIHKKR